MDALCAQQHISPSFDYNGGAHMWYESLPTLRQTWPEWKGLLAETLPKKEKVTQPDYFIFKKLRVDQ